MGARHSRQEAAAFIDIGVTKFDELVEAGIMPQPREIGTRKIWVRTELEVAFISLPTNEEEQQNDWDAV